MNKSVITGMALITIGAIFLLPNFTSLTLRDLWPILMFGPGILFFAGFLSDRNNYGLLMPGSILTTYGLLFLTCSIFGWEEMELLWPAFILGPGAGFLLMYFFGKKELGLLIPGAIFSTLALLFFFHTTRYGEFWPLIIIAAGVLLILNSRKKPPAA
jgi:hypothetical protein